MHLLRFHVRRPEGARLLLKRLELRNSCELDSRIHRAEALHYQVATVPGDSGKLYRLVGLLVK